MKKISFVKIKNKNIQSILYETTRWVWIIYPLNYLKRRSKYPNKIISKIKQYLQDDNASMNIPSKPLRRWSKDDLKIIKKKNSQNEIEKCFTKSKQEYTNNIIRDDKASMNIPSKPLRRWSKIKTKNVYKIKLKNNLQNQNENLSFVKNQNKNIQTILYETTRWVWIYPLNL